MFRRRLAPLALLIAGFLVATSVAAAQSPADSAARGGRSPIDSVPAAFRRGASEDPIDVIDSAEIASAHAETLSELLLARRPGLSVSPKSGALSQGADVRLRGPTSAVLANQPIVYVDGVRVGNSLAFGSAPGASLPSQLDDIIPEDVVRIELVRGAATASRFGPGGANGAILVTTRRGARTPHLDVGAERGITIESADFPDNVFRSTSTSSTQACTLESQAGGACTPGTLSRFNPLERHSPFRTGELASAHLGASGSVLGIDSYLGAAVRSDRGVTTADSRERRSLRLSLDREIVSSLAVDVGGNESWSASRLAPVFGALSSDNPLLLGLLGYATETPNNGYLQLQTPSFAGTRPHENHRTGHAALRWHPIAAAEAQLLVGRDVERALDDREFAFVGSGATGLDRTELRNERNTVAGDASFSWRFRGVAARSGVGGEHYRRSDHALDALTANGLVSSTETWSRFRSTTLWLVQSLGSGEPWRVEGSLARVARDNVPAASAQLLPAIAAEWRAWARGARSLDIAARLGDAAAQEADFDPQAAMPIEGPSGWQRVREMEVEARIRLSESSAVTVRTFRATSTNVLFPQSLPFFPGMAPKPGAAMRNVGLEAMARLVLLDRGPALRWTTTAGALLLRNTIISSGLPPINGFFTTMRAGAPLGAIHGLPYTYDDTNHDGLIATSEITFGPDRVLGSSFPTRELSLLTVLERPAARVRLGLQLDYRGGFEAVDGVDLARCWRNCAAFFDPATSLAEQAEVVASQLAARGAGFRNAGDFLTLRELSLAAGLPASLTLSVIGRDLFNLTRARGFGPPVPHLGIVNSPYDFASLPLPRRWIVRLDVAR